MKAPNWLYLDRKKVIITVAEFAAGFAVGYLIRGW